MAIQAVLFVRYFCEVKRSQLEGKNCDIFTSNDKIESFIKKINIWKSRVEKNRSKCFPVSTIL